MPIVPLTKDRYCTHQTESSGAFQTRSRLHDLMQGSDGLPADVTFLGFSNFPTITFHPLGIHLPGPAYAVS